jgi:hypothetical protein
LAGVVKILFHDSEGVTHENLIYPMAGEQVSGGQLAIVPGVSGGDGKDVVLHVWQEVMLLEDKGSGNK